MFYVWLVVVSILVGMPLRPKGQTIKDYLIKECVLVITWPFFLLLGIYTIASKTYDELKESLWPKKNE